MNKVQLQGIGSYPGSPAGELKKGDVIIWNFGYKSIVIDIVKRTKAQITVLLKTLDSDYIAERRLGINRLIVKEQGGII